MKFQYNQTQALNELKNLVDINSFTSNKAGVDRMGQTIKQFLSDIPLRWETHLHAHKGNLLIATTEPKTKYGKILLSGHLDTVHPPKTDFSFKKINDYLYSGPGISDMKTGLIVILYTLRNLYLNNALRNLTLILSPDEERLSQAHQKTLSKIYPQHDYAFIFENTHEQIHKPNMHSHHQIITRRKGAGIYTINIKGQAGHSGIIEKQKDRKSAILELAHLITQLENLANYKKGTTLNIGKISGGKAVNVIAPQTQAEFDIRAWQQNEFDRLTKNIKQLEAKSAIQGCKRKISNQILIPPLIPNCKSKYLYQIIQHAGLKLDLKISENQRQGTSDGNLISQHGVGTVDGMGIIGNGGHTTQETVYIPSIATATKLATLSIINLLPHIYRKT